MRRGGRRGVGERGEEKGREERRKGDNLISGRRWVLWWYDGMV